MHISERYSIKNRLGSQGKRKFGEVYLVEDKKSGKRALMKAVRKSAESTLVADRLRAEATYSFDVPGLPTTYFLEESDTEIFLVRSYMDGLPLDEYWKTVKRKSQLTFLIELLQRLVPIFDHLSTQGIVHCDIKPSNILIEDTGNSFNVHLIDFGLAINRNDPLEVRSTLFPLGFAAPELLLNQLDLVGPQTDFYALGITIWRLYTGKLPLTHPNPSIFTNLQLTHPLPEHSEVPKQVYRILVKLCHKHTFKLPPNRMDSKEVHTYLAEAIRERPATMQEILADFEGIRKRKWW